MCRCFHLCTYTVSPKLQLHVWFIYACVCTRLYTCPDSVSCSSHVIPPPLPAWEDPSGVVEGVWLGAHAQAPSSWLFID